jgi:hypothetical protein
MVRPNKVDKLLAKKPYLRGWYQRKENLAMNRLIGPFNFTQIDSEANQIDAKHWKSLLTLSAEHNIEARDVNSIVPIKEKYYAGITPLFIRFYRTFKEVEDPE